MNIVYNMKLLLILALSLTACNPMVSGHIVTFDKDHALLAEYEDCFERRINRAKTVESIFEFVELDRQLADCRTKARHDILGQTHLDNMGHDIQFELNMCIMYRATELARGTPPITTCQ